MRTSQLLSLTGGLITAIWGAAEIVIGLIIRQMGFNPLFSAVAYALGAWGICLGVLLIASSYSKERNFHLAAAILCIPGLATFQGLLLGPALGVAGSFLALKESKN